MRRYVVFTRKRLQILKGLCESRERMDVGAFLLSHTGYTCRITFAYIKDSLS